MLQFCLCASCSELQPLPQETEWDYGWFKILWKSVYTQIDIISQFWFCLEVGCNEISKMLQSWWRNNPLKSLSAHFYLEDFMSIIGCLMLGFIGSLLLPHCGLGHYKHWTGFRDFSSQLRMIGKWIPTWHLIMLSVSISTN